MTPAELMALAQQLLYDCCDPVTGEPLYTGQSSYACVEDVEAAAHYLRACAEAEPVATVRVHDTGGNAGIAWTGVPTENSGVMRGGTPLYTHPQPPSAQAEPVAWRITDGEGGYDYRDDPPEDWQVAWVARWGRKHEPLYTQPPEPARQPMTEREIIGGFEVLPEALTFFTAFEAGVRHAERHHRIGSNSEETDFMNAFDDTHRNGSESK